MVDGWNWAALLVKVIMLIRAQWQVLKGKTCHQAAAIYWNKRCWYLSSSEGFAWESFNSEFPSCLLIVWASNTTEIKSEPGEMPVRSMFLPLKANRNEKVCLTFRNEWKWMKGSKMLMLEIFSVFKRSKRMRFQEKGLEWNECSEMSYSFFQKKGQNKRFLR